MCNANPNLKGFSFVYFKSEDQVFEGFTEYTLLTGWQSMADFREPPKNLFKRALEELAIANFRVKNVSFESCASQKVTAGLAVPVVPEVPVVPVLCAPTSDTLPGVNTSIHVSSERFDNCEKWRFVLCRE